MNEDEIKRAKKALENCRFGKLGDKHQENPWFPDLNENQKQRMEALEAMSFEDRDKWLNGEWNPTHGAQAEFLSRDEAQYIPNNLISSINASARCSGKTLMMEKVAREHGLRMTETIEGEIVRPNAFIKYIPDNTIGVKPEKTAIEGEVLESYQREAISKLCETRHGKLFARVEGIDLLIGDVLEISGFAPNSSVKNGMYNITAEGIRPISSVSFPIVDTEEINNGLQKLADAFQKLGKEVRITFNSLGALEGNDLENPLAKFAKQMVERKNAAEPPFWANNYRKNKRGKGKR